MLRNKVRVIEQACRGPFGNRQIPQNPPQTPKTPELHSANNSENARKFLLEPENPVMIFGTGRDLWTIIPV
jgi:hypothetical protein